MDIENCLTRIRYRGPVNPDITNLRALQLAFLLSVPFENLDIHLGREIRLNPVNIFEKIVIKERGGVCYENNILFHEILKALGYRVEYLSARIVKGGKTGPEYDHMVLLVALDGKDYLVDVGKGVSSREPLALDGPTSGAAEGLSYKVVRHGKDYALYGKRPQTDWTSCFIFSTFPRARSEFEAMNSYHQSSPDSPFTRRRMATIATPGGRVSLIDRRLTITDSSDRLGRQLSSEAEYHESLKHYFGIEIG